MKPAPRSNLSEPLSNSRNPAGTRLDTTRPDTPQESNSTTTADALLLAYAHASSGLMQNIAHDLRTPLTAIRGFLKLMLNSRLGTISDEQRKCLEGAMSGVDELTRIAATISGSSRFMKEFHPEEVNFQELWRRVSARVQPHWVEKGLRIQESHPERVPTVCGDRRMMEDVFEKLAIHACTHAARDSELQVDILGQKTGSVVLRITLKCGSPGLEMQTVVSELHPTVFLHGGQLTYNVSNDNRLVFTLSLPGYDA